MLLDLNVNLDLNLLHHHDPSTSALPGAAAVRT
jgi:hypothetical protein